MQFEKKNLIGVILGVIIIIASLIFLRGTTLMYFVMVLALVAAFLPFMISFVLYTGRQKEKDVRFLEFVRDLVETVKAGTPVSKAIINLRRREYGPLSEHVQKLASQVSLGIPLTKALFIFAAETKSKVISRAVSLIAEAERAGGRIDTILESVSKSVNQTENLKKEQQAAISNLIVQGYIIFIVFIIIMLVLQFQILPLTGEISEVDNLSVKSQQHSSDEFSTPLFVMLLVQAFFAGLVIGKVSEGDFKHGIKHSFILLALALLITTGANLLLGEFFLPLL